VIPVIALALVTAVLAWFATRRWLAHAHERDTVAVPNERSSHTRPTPTGGGVALVGAVFCVLVHTGWFGVQGTSLGMAIPALAVLAAGSCGMVDDIRGLRPLKKMSVMTAIGLVLAFMEPLAGVELPVGPELAFGALAIPLTLFWLAGFTNAFNFMDGIDGIAALTALVSGAAFCAAGLLAGDGSLAVLGAVTAGGALGFLPWNFPKARIFMGDAGSLPLGLLLSFSAVLAQASGALPFAASVLLLGPFVFDASFTLFARALRGEKVWRAHREHLYQRLSRIWSSHPKVSMLYAGFSVVTAVLALLYGDLSPLGRLLSLGVPFAAMLAFAAWVLAADRRREARAAAAPDTATS
jgi:UDP-N-acetylmuramyl pentapeptide phosphotransferase/UDP-N-acetylglucosamine-1-phosphate transferase